MLLHFSHRLHRCAACQLPVFRTNGGLCLFSCPKRVILLGCSHHYEFSGACVATKGSFETPIGTLPIDKPFALALANGVNNADVAPHIPEHSLEVHLPFVQVALGDVPIVPVLFGSRYSAQHAEFAQRLVALAEPLDLVIASTDLSHFLSEEEARAQDARSLDFLMTKNIDTIIEASEDGRCAMCGLTAVITAGVYALKRKALDWRVLDYRTSAAASGDYSRVVGYATVSMGPSQ